ncbi:unnamed protein product [Rotaria socialis]|uniref:VPS37 C-terminal domain-containing protein n=1 Tax=Rotaria socialis TaxID=392032 RepID=A0A818P154_9BILA|nr:unnamed protein product [Rotaria socialis]CAF3223870.1 unnamed protein product [Rotaria socialis]CAF3603860.1 unnamed protein product [Rotaria socialis]CAF3616268.1 unnamed protein product [Rotaria socialis]CAF4208668.1 unnamed protein product [Rotaria socialis]
MINSYYTNHENPLNEVRSIISQKNADELANLINNEDEIARLIGNLGEIQQMETIKESLKENIKRLALQNLDKEPMLIHEKEKLASLCDEVNRAKNEYKSIQQLYDEQIGETNPEMIWVLLQTAASELERSTDETAETFFTGEKTENEVTEFERRFIENRKRAHELKIKAEKFHELMQLSQSTSHLTSDQYIHGSGYR